VQLFTGSLQLFVFSGCKIEVVVPAGGAVTTKSESYQCDSGDSCVIDVVDVFFNETLAALPDAGYTFLQWKKRDRGLCAGKCGNCSVVPSLAEVHELFMATLESDTTYYLAPDFGQADTWARKA
jgi:hypothetical protein